MMWILVLVHLRPSLVCQRTTEGPDVQGRDPPLYAEGPGWTRTLKNDFLSNLIGLFYNKLKQNYTFLSSHSKLVLGKGRWKNQGGRIFFSEGEGRIFFWPGMGGGCSKISSLNYHGIITEILIEFTKFNNFLNIHRHFHGKTNI